MSDNLICEKDEIKDLMPYEKCMEFGAGSLTDTELVAAIIKTGTAGMAKAAQLKCICELSRRIAKRQAAMRLKFSSPDTIAGYYMEDMRYLTKERLILIMLDSRLGLISDIVLSIGTVNSSLVSPSEVFYEACRNKAVSIVLVHNHPSGDSNPSRQDIEVTDKISKAGEILGIHLIDHIIIGDNNYTSLKEYGCIG